MKTTLAPLLLCILLSACGGGSSENTATPPVTSVPPPVPVPVPVPEPVPVPVPVPVPEPVPAPVLTLSSPTIRTIVNGRAVPLTAKLSSGGAIRWQLAAGAPGTLSASTGDTVRYLPPTDGAGTPVTVTVTASGDGASAALTLAVAPDPGKPGVMLVPWRTGSEPTMLEPRDVAVDLAGNIYVVLQTVVTPSRRGPASLVKIAPDGTITPLIGTTWFGQPPSAEKADLIDTRSGMVVDRAGNLYFGIPSAGSTSPTASILKITPAGVTSVLAGGAVTQTSESRDGTGAAAQFGSMRLAGIDYDDNLYVRDTTTLRKVTPAGVVTTVSAFPSGLDADMSGYTYSYDQATSKLQRTSPEGTTSVVPGVQNCVDQPADSTGNCLRSGYLIIPASGASLVTYSSQGVRRVILEH